MVRESHLKHVSYVKADRTAHSRAIQLAEDSAQGRLAREEGLIYLCIDGMDQSKFRIPRNVQSSKEWDSCWRPQLHVAGCLAFGVGEWYFFSDQDLKKDSSAELTMISYVLEEVANAYHERCLPVPLHLVVMGDNTSRELKNQVCDKYFAWMTAQGRFRSIEVHGFRVGHTHNVLDQRFWVGAAALSRARLLQTPDDCMARSSRVFVGHMLLVDMYVCRLLSRLALPCALYLFMRCVSVSPHFFPG